MVSTEARVVCDGTLKIDGGALFGQLPKTVWENIVSTDRKNRITLNESGRQGQGKLWAGPQQNVQGTEERRPYSQGH